MSFEEARVRIGDIRNALADGLDREDIAGMDEDYILFVNGVEIDQADINAACELCEGEGVPEPEPAVDPNLIADFVAAIRRGDIATARAMVDRVFDNTDDSRTVDAALCRCAA